MRAVVILCLLGVVAHLARAQCPWEEAGLKDWNDASAWSGGIPVANANVVIENGMKIRLNVSPPALHSINIRQGGKLVWGNVDNIQLKVSYILVGNDSSFWIGSEGCKFTKNATITLTGRQGSATLVTGFGSKFIGVQAGGTVEFHGQLPSPSWTQLAATATSNRYKLQRGNRGMSVVVFNETNGDVIDTQLFDTHNASGPGPMGFANYLNSLPNGRLVAVAIADEGRSGLNETVFLAAESIGSGLVRQVVYRGSWAIIGRKGSAIGTAYEAIGNRTQLVSVNQTFTVGANTFVIEVRSAGMEAGNVAYFDKIGNLQPIITLATNVQWRPGMRIALASTDFNYQQTEEATIIACPSCAANQVKLSAPLQYAHFGEVVHGVDMRGEVGLLTRNILIQGEMEPACYGDQYCEFFDYDTFGGHFKMVHGFRNAHIEAVEFYHMGQQILAMYPVHFHLAGDVDERGGYTNPAYVKDSSIHRSFSRCVTIHGTHGLLVKNNVAFDHLGHCFFLEDGIEVRNVLDGNLAMVTRPGTLLPSDRDTNMCLTMNPTNAAGQPTNPDECNGISTFWIENPNNIIINNVAAGSHDTGFWYIFPPKPTGDSEVAGAGVFPQRTALGKFDNNRAHSNSLNGLFFDRGIKNTPATPSSPRQYLSMGDMRYKPRVNQSDPNSARAPAVLTRFTAYKNGQRGVWVRGGDFRFVDCYFSDNFIGMTLASEGVLPNDPGSSQTLVGGVFVGESHNHKKFFSTHTELDRRAPIRGFEVYDGPVSATNVTFRKFYPTQYRNASAIGWLLSNSWQLSPYNNISKANFDDSLRVYTGMAGVPYFGNKDGDTNIVFRDLDGSVSGVRNGLVVKNTPYFHTYRCVEKPEWNAQVCHEGMGQLFINNLNTTHTNYGTAGDGGLIMMRDERTAYEHPLVGIPSTDPTTQFQPLVYLGKTYTVHFPHATPPSIRVQMVNFNPNETVRLGVCFPTSTSAAEISLTVRLFNNATTKILSSVNSLQEVDASVQGNVYYYDRETGLVFIKLVALRARVEDNYCPPGGCEWISITATGSRVGANSGRCNAYPKYAVVEQIPADPGCIGELDECGVCNGDGTSCLPPTQDDDAVSGAHITSTTTTTIAAAMAAVLFGRLL